MNTIGKKNMLFGFIYMIVTVGLGMLLANKLGGSDPQWFDSMTRKLLKTAHVHGNLEAVLNVIIGFVICRYGSPTRAISRAASVLAINGAIFHSGMLFMGGLGVPVMTKVAPLGAISMLLAVVLMVVVVLKGVDEK